jgi:hypothetical protein
VRAATFSFQVRDLFSAERVWQVWCWPSSYVGRWKEEATEEEEEEEEEVERLGASVRANLYLRILNDDEWLVTYDL